MDPLKTYDYLVRARQLVFDWTRPLGADDYARTFPIGLGTLARTLTHTMSSEWYYMQRMLAREVPPYEEWLFRHEDPPPFAVLEAAWTEEAARTRAGLAAVREWTTELEYRVVADEGPVIITASPADIFTQLALHEVHHRAQATAMLRQLGIVIEGLDFNLMTYGRRPAE